MRQQISLWIFLENHPLTLKIEPEPGQLRPEPRDLRLGPALRLTALALRRPRVVGEGEDVLEADRRRQLVQDTPGPVLAGRGGGELDPAPQLTKQLINQSINGSTFLFIYLV